MEQELTVTRSHIAVPENYGDALDRLQRFEYTEIHRDWVDSLRFSRSLGDSARIICAGKTVSVVTNNLAPQLHIDTEAVMQVCDNILSNAPRYARNRVPLSLWTEGDVLAVSLSHVPPAVPPQAISPHPIPPHKGQTPPPPLLGLAPS